MRRLWLMAATAVSMIGQLAFGQLAPPNDAGVSIGHIHLTVPDPDAQVKVWVDVLGATASKDGFLTLVKLPGIFIIVSKSTSTEGSNGSTANHFGFLVKDYAALETKLAAANIPAVFDNKKNQMIVTFPDQIRVEFMEDTSISTPVVFHHIHLMTTDPSALQAWYVKTFAAEASTRRNLPAAKLPGGEVDFLMAKEAPAPTKGRTLDHIGFEIKDLDAFCKKLTADGMTFDMAYRDVPALGLKIAFIIDPVGTRIELTQGLEGR
ncbi:MAG TPA: VOC family protein [Bryobacteraceae bacterium]|jgi:catechol 2,3-dioxygenase-like lactoylglutathione lyase family enzyme|nr:VOC family protein [Bryobacteraceae bacterium]